MDNEDIFKSEPLTGEWLEPDLFYQLKKEQEKIDQKVAQRVEKLRKQQTFDGTCELIAIK